MMDKTNGPTPTLRRRHNSGLFAVLGAIVLAAFSTMLFTQWGGTLSFVSRLYLGVSKEATSAQMLTLTAGSLRVEDLAVRSAMYVSHRLRR